MIKLFLSKTLTELKNVMNWLKDCLRLVASILPLTTILVAMASLVLFYGIMTQLLFFLFPKLNVALEKIAANVWNIFVSMICVLSEFVLNNFGILFIVGFLLIVAMILEFINKRKKRARFPVIGIPNKDNIAVLLALLKIRSLEMARTYAIIRKKQDKAKDENWIGLFLAEYFDHYTNIWEYDDKLREQQEQYNKDACAMLLTENFDFCPWGLGESEDIKRKNLMIGFILEYRIYNAKPLHGIRTYGLIDNTISSLIKEYDKFNSRSSAIFIHDKPIFRFLKPKILASHATINEIWKGILFSFRASLVLLRLKNDTSVNIEEILKQIDALIAVQDDSAILDTMVQKNSKNDYRSFSCASEEQEKLIIDQLDNNLIRELY